MAVDNQPAPAQPASPGLTISRDFIQVISVSAVLAAVIIAGMALVVSMAVAPLRENMRSLRTEMRSGFEAVGSEFKAVRGEITSLRQDMNNEFKAVRSDMADIRERLTRVETLLDLNADRPGVPDAPDARQ